MDIEKLKYPIGKFSYPVEFTPQNLNEAISEIEEFPNKVKQAVINLSDLQLDTPYREGGWTIRQVVHHCADSHINSLIRYKLALTEDNPTIKPYEEQLWAELADGKNIPIEPSMKMLEGIHYRWAVLLKSMNEEQFNRTFVHPSNNEKMTLKRATAMYAWHGKHHLGHITNIIEKEGWS
ncbi:DinB superfamily protein [Flavobacteriaceae bacterium MAR_2010_188]|nr:DinB superfamily protein [Flavobacteriaceae bacterium MAR_2010_188]